MRLHRPWGTLRYGDEGRGPLVVLLHPLALSGAVWRRLAVSVPKYSAASAVMAWKIASSSAAVTPSAAISSVRVWSRRGEVDSMPQAEKRPG